LTNPEIPGAAQPYHAARNMKLEEAEAFLERCARRTGTMARKAVQDVIGELAQQGYRVGNSCLLSSSGRATTDLATILKSHPLIHTAEGEFFRASLRAACEGCGLAVSTVKEKELLSHSAKVLGVPPNDLERRASALGKSLGSPWRHDEKLCALAGWLVLERSVPHKTD
jgi:hypothetical protein